MLVSLLFGFLVLLPEEFRQLGKHVAGGAGFVSNLVLLLESGYFDNASETKPLLHLWSLGIEEQFYLVYPLLMFVVWRTGWNRFVVLLIASMASFLGSLYLVGVNPVADFYLPLTRFWELLAGGLLACSSGLTGALDSRFSRFRDAVSWGGLVLIAAGVRLIDRDSPFPGWWAILPVLGASLFISAGPHAFLNRVVMASPLAVWLGLISYPLYLWHWPLLVWPVIVTGEPLSPSLRLGMVLLGVLLAWATFRLLEARLRHGGRRVALVLVALMAAVGLTGLTGATGLARSRHDSSQLQPILDARFDWDFPGQAFKRVPDRKLLYFQAGRGVQKTLFVGDSNMEQYAPRIGAVISDPGAGEGLNSAILVGNQTTKLLEDVLAGGSTGEAALQRLSDLASDPAVTTVVLAASWHRYGPGLMDPARFSRFVQYFDRLAAGKRLFVVLNIPSGPELDPRNMFTGSRLGSLSLKTAREARFDMTAFRRRLDRVHGRVREFSALTGATVIDPILSLCPGGICPMFDANGTPLYKDDTHMTATYARTGATFIDVTLREPRARPAS